MRVRSALVYTVLRLAAFLVPLGIMMLSPVLREYFWLSAIFAALIGLSLSVLFLRRPLDQATAGLAERRAAKRRETDEDVEDAVAGAPASVPPAESTGGDARD
ncbi:DUF4229 domain-containing protein [Microbacterium sp.]|uniref:DUF4229 domain-containing protein n=1 Tax=Microbacterium sp. TaxID=51671 RepID=UPI003C793EAD